MCAQGRTLDTKTVTLVTRICMENHPEGWYFQDTKDCVLLLLNEPNYIKARTSPIGKARWKEFHDKVISLYYFLRVFWHFLLRFSHPRHLQVNTAQRNNTRHMVAKKVKKVVPIIYREFFDTVDGKLAPTSTIASLQGAVYVCMHILYASAFVICVDSKVGVEGCVLSFHRRVVVQACERPTWESSTSRGVSPSVSS